MQAFAGDLWRLIDPWRTVYDAADWLYRRLGWGSGLSLRLPYPSWLGAWPACLLLLGFSWIELISPNAAEPAFIARLAIGYSILTWAGMLAFGRDAWLRHGEVFSLVFGTLARFAPTEAKDDRLLLRPFGAGLLEAPPLSTSMMAFVLLLLATVLYDGLIGTGEWAMLEEALRPVLPVADDTAATAIRTAGLVAIWLVFLAAYIGISACMSKIAGGHPDAVEVAQRFALTLVPIAIGYHVAHYLVFLLVQGQYIVPLLSDPFGYGWNLLGTSGYRVDIGLVGARFAWYAAVASIVIGHVTAVYLAHVKAIGLFDTPGAALKSQVPLTALMVVYTFIGLSIAAQPIVESRAAATPSAVATEMWRLFPFRPESCFLGVRTAGWWRPRQDGQGEAVLQGARLCLSRRHQNDRGGPALRLRLCLSVGPSRRRQRYPLRPLIDAATVPLRRHLVAVRPVGVDAGSKSFLVGDVKFVREVFAFEVYLDIAPADPDWNAVVAPPWSTLPWHVLALMEEAVKRGWAAFSEVEANRRGVPWLDLVRSSELNARLASLVADFERTAFRPDALRSYVAEDEARRRWRALAAFYQASGHFLVTNGPYRLKAWAPQTVTLEAFRDLTYPLGVGSYDAYAVPRRGFITKVDRRDGRLTISADIEVVEKFQRSYRLVRMALNAVPGPMLKRAAPECRYLLTDAEGRVALAGTLRPGADATFQVDLEERLPGGRYTLSAFIAVNGNAMNAEIYRTPLVVSPHPQ